MEKRSSEDIAKIMKEQLVKAMGKDSQDKFDVSVFKKEDGTYSIDIHDGYKHDNVLIKEIAESRSMLMAAIDDGKIAAKTSPIDYFTNAWGSCVGFHIPQDLSEKQVDQLLKSLENIDPKKHTGAYDKELKDSIEDGRTDKDGNGKGGKIPIEERIAGIDLSGLKAADSPLPQDPSAQRLMQSAIANDDSLSI